MSKIITTSYSEGFEHIFEEIREKRPDLSNNSEVAKEAVRTLWKLLKSKEKGNLNDGSIVQPAIFDRVFSNEWYVSLPQSSI